MTITAISAQQRDVNRVNVFVDGKYRFSLDITQVVDLGIKIGRDYSEEQLIELEDESRFGKLYMRALEYTMMRPHSSKEIKDYLRRKTRDTRTKEGAIKRGVSIELTERVYDKLVSKGYVDDENFARYWVENRNLRKGMSRRKLALELSVKGIPRQVIEASVARSERSDEDELKKVIAKKRNRYEDDQKLIQYLMRQGFSYDSIKLALAEDQD